jgi:hypothetical protein
MKIVNDKLITENSTREKFSNLKSTGLKFALEPNGEKPISTNAKRVKFV